jgi:DNA polymerase-3 subunit delta
VPSWKPAFLIHGDDHGRLAERRANFRAAAEAESGPGSVEVLEGDTADPENVAAVVSAMTLAMSRRFIVVEGVERWKETDVAPIAGILKDPPPETTVVFFAREEGRSKAPKALHDAVKKAGGTIDSEMNVKPWKLPEWVGDEARKLGLTLDQGAAKALITHVGDRQQRLLRELEKLQLDLGDGATISADDVEELTANSAERKVWSLADALVAADSAAATGLYVELRARGQGGFGLQRTMTKRLQEALAVAIRLDAGESAGEVRKTLRMPPKAASLFIADVQRLDRDRLRKAVQLMADLEYVSRGGGARMDEDTAALRAIAEIAA